MTDRETYSVQPVAAGADMADFNPLTCKVSGQTLREVDAIFDHRNYAPHVQTAARTAEDERADVIEYTNQCNRKMDYPWSMFTQALVNGDHVGAATRAKGATGE